MSNENETPKERKQRLANDRKREQRMRDKGRFVEMSVKIPTDRRDDLKALVQAWRNGEDVAIGRDMEREVQLEQEMSSLRARIAELESEASRMKTTEAKLHAEVVLLRKANARRKNEPHFVSHKPTEIEGYPQNDARKIADMKKGRPFGS